MLMRRIMIDVGFDFTSDAPGYWDGFWDDKYGRSRCDPDRDSPKELEYSKMAWGRTLPNGQFLDLKISGKRYVWNRRRLSNDSITASFRHPGGRPVIDAVMQEMGEEFRPYMESYIHQSWTIGGVIVFPIPEKVPGRPRVQSMNQARGIHPRIKDRFDLTLECIRLYYIGDGSLLSISISACSWFFDLFLDFRGFVDFFLLQDLVEDDYEAVRIWRGDKLGDDPLPSDVNEYKDWIENQKAFVKKRADRISQLAASMELSASSGLRFQSSIDGYFQ